MENYVVIDLGSNSVRLRITNIADDGTLTVTHQLKEYVRLSENMGQEKTLKQEPIKRTLQALKSFKDIYSKLENPNCCRSSGSQSERFLRSCQKKA